MGYLSTVPSDEKTNAHSIDHEHFVSTTVYGSALAGTSRPRFELCEDEMPARTAMRLVHDELLMVNRYNLSISRADDPFLVFKDGNPALNLASFVTTYAMLYTCESTIAHTSSRYMEEEAEKLMMENLSKAGFSSLRIAGRF